MEISPKSDLVGLIDVPETAGTFGPIGQITSEPQYPEFEINPQGREFRRGGRRRFHTRFRHSVHRLVGIVRRDDRDQKFVRTALPDGFDWLTSALPALATGEAIIVGEGVSIPMQVQFRALGPDEQPASQTPAFARAWSRDVRDPAFIQRTISRWRLQQR